MKQQPKGFWEIIKYINWKELAEQGRGDTDTARERLLEKLDTPQSIKFITGREEVITYQVFQDTFEELVSLIQDEVNNREDKPCFAKGVAHGADDCHFMDMPAHLVGLGRKSVTDFLEGGLVEHEVVECMSYMFHGE